MATCIQHLFPYAERVLFHVTSWKFYRSPIFWLSLSSWDTFWMQSYWHVTKVQLSLTGANNCVGRAESKIRVDPLRWGRTPKKSTQSRVWASPESVSEIEIVWVTPVSWKLQITWMGSSVSKCPAVFLSYFSIWIWFREKGDKCKDQIEENKPAE